jgi:phage tail-like protein
MPNELLSTDPIVARMFYLEIDGENIVLSGVSGISLELDVVSTQQVGPSGKVQHIKTLGQITKVPEIVVTRMAPMDAMSDPLWKWFTEVRTKGFTGTSRATNRKNGSVVMYDTALTEVARFNFMNAWPNKIATDGLSSDSNEMVKETITLVVESIDRVK